MLSAHRHNPAAALVFVFYMLGRREASLQAGRDAELKQGGEHVGEHSVDLAAVRDGTTRLESLGVKCAENSSSQEKGRRPLT